MSTSTSVRLPDQLMERIRHASKTRRKPVNRLIVEALEKEFKELPPNELRADIGLKEYIGMFSSEGIGDGFDSSRSSEYFGKILEQKHREGHL